MDQPDSHFFQAQGLRLHYLDWGNAGAPSLLLIHGGADHARSWDRLARALRPHYHVIAPDLRGHGDSDWMKGGSYSLPEYVYDLSCLIRQIGPPVTLIGHSMGGMISALYSGAFPEQVGRLVVLDGITTVPGAPRPAPHERIAKWISQLDKLEDRVPRRYATIADAAAQMRSHNRRLSEDLALHLATHGTRRAKDGSYGWKFDPTQRVVAPHRLSGDDYAALWQRIACPTLLLFASDSFLGDSAAAGVGSYFKNVRIETVADAGHWLQHDQPDEVLRLIGDFLQLP